MNLLPAAVLVALSLIAFSAQLVTCKDVPVEFNIRYARGAPNGVTSQVLAVNNRFPGPTIYAEIGDILRVKVNNNIQTGDNTSIHWHGIEMYHDIFDDGPQMVTQCPIQSGSSYTYQFELQQAGTYWWHSHHNYQYTEGFLGALIVNNKPEVYDNLYQDEQVIILSEWYHKPVPEVSRWFLSNQNTNGFLPYPDSLLINGRGFYNCSVARRFNHACNANQDFTVFNVPEKTTVRLRLINAASMVTLSFAIDEHKMRVIEVDGVDTVLGNPVDSLTIAPAQRYSVLVEMTGETKDYWIRVAAVNMPPPTTPNSNDDPTAFDPTMRAILRYTPAAPGSAPATQFQPLSAMAVTFIQSLLSGRRQGRPSHHDDGRLNDILTDNANSSAAAAPHLGQTFMSLEHIRSTRRPTTRATTNGVQLDEQTCRPFNGGDAPNSFTNQYILNTQRVQQPDQSWRWSFNGTVYTMNPNREPALLQVLSERRVNPGFHPIQTPVGRRRVIQLVVNNPSPAAHPFHLHGHTFWVLGTGAASAGNFSTSRDSSVLRLDGVRRDTFTVNPNSWTVIRYLPDNPGTWLFHCHINWHLEAGLALVFVEGQEVTRKSFVRTPRDWKDLCARSRVNVSRI